MAGNNKNAKSRWETLDSYYKFCVGLVLLIFAKDRVIDAFNTFSLRGPNWEVALLSGVVLVGIVFLVLFWIKSVSDEMQMLKDNLYSYILKLPSSTFITVVGLSALLGALAYLSDNIVKFSFVFVFFKLFEIWSLWLRDSMLKPAIHKAKSEISEEKMLANIIAIENYYLKRPQIPLAVTVMFFSFVSTILGLLSEIRDSYELIVIAYFIMILTITINELVYASWRRKRDAILEADE